MTRHRRLAAALLVAAVVLAGCDGLGDGDDGDGREEKAETTEQTTERAPAVEATIEFALVERLTPDYLSEHPRCPRGEFEPTKDFLTTFPLDSLPEVRQPPQSYSCGGRVDQVVHAQFEDPADARKLLAPRNAFNAASLVGGDSVVLVNLGVEDEVDIRRFFREIIRECDCGRTRYKRP